MDKRTLTVLKAMARGPICYDDCSSECLHCEANPYDELNWKIESSDIGELIHKPDCPVLVARALLKENGTPIQVYKVTYEYYNNFAKTWPSTSPHVLAYSPEEAASQFSGSGNKHRIRNVAVTLVRSLPE